MVKYCSQCHRDKPIADFTRGKRIVRDRRTCNECAARYSGWSRLSLSERHARMKPIRVASSEEGRILFIANSQNRKLGNMPLSISDRSTCPPSCAFFDAGCYFGYSFMRFHWGRVPTEGLTWNAFLAEVRALPPRTLWRHNEAGDLPGRGERIDLGKLAELVLANMGRRGWSFTHKTLITDAEVHAVARANRDGFTINLSADTLEEADARADLGAGPVVVVLPSGSPTRGLYTPAGRKVVVCPAQTHALTCADCQLCAVPTRKSIIAFRAHGQGAEGALETARGLFQLRRKPAEPARRTA